MKVCFVIWPIETLIERASMDGVLEYRMSHQYFLLYTRIPTKQLYLPVLGHVLMCRCRTDTTITSSWEL